MYLVINERTGVIERKCRTLMWANSVAFLLTEQHEWVGGDTFDVQVA